MLEFAELSSDRAGPREWEWVTTADRGSADTAANYRSDRGGGRQWAGRIVLAASIVAAARTARSAEQRQVLQAFPAAPYTYELSLDACPGPTTNAPGGPACTFVVRLLKGGKTLASVDLAQAACGPPAKPTPVSIKLGADREANAWITRDGNCDIQVAARTVALGPKTTALLVTALQGSEYRYRHHALYLPINDELISVWSHNEPDIAGEWTTTSVIPGAAGGDDVALVVVERDDRGRASKVHAERVGQDPATRQIVARALPDVLASLFVMYVGRFKSSREAWPHAATGSCLRDLELMRAGLFPRLRLPPFFMGAVFARKEDADAALARFATCPEAKVASGVLVDEPTDGPTTRR